MRPVLSALALAVALSAGATASASPDRAGRSVGMNPAEMKIPWKPEELRAARAKVSPGAAMFVAGMASVANTMGFWWSAPFRMAAGSQRTARSR